MENEERTQGVSELQKAEIEALAEKGNVTPEEVVEFASDPKTALHSRFEWDDSEAARKYRVEQARQVIRAVVTVIEHHESGALVKIRAYTSLSTDRLNGIGYRRTVDVMSDDDLCAIALVDAQRDFSKFHDKYKDLTALQSVFAAANKVFGKNKKTKRKSG